MKAKRVSPAPATFSGCGWNCRSILGALLLGRATHPGKLFWTKKLPRKIKAHAAL